MSTTPNSSIPPNVPESPTRPSSGSYLNFASNLTGSQKSTRMHLAVDLRGRVHYDVDLTGYFPGLNSLRSADFLDDSKRTIITQQVSALEKLLDSGKPKVNKKDGRSKAEVLMYPPLVDIFDAVTSSTISHEDISRRVIDTSGVTLDGEGQHLPSDKPDFLGIDVPKDFDKNKLRVAKLFRRQSCFFVEIKWEENMDPKPMQKDTESVKELTRQMADYAAQLLAVRSFNLFVFGIAIFGKTFRVGVFDRGGILFSQPGKIGDELFLCVIYLMTTTMDDRVMGMDENVKRLEGHHWYDQSFPSFSVGYGQVFVGSSMAPMITQRTPPLWASLLLLGRGTVTWKTTRETVLKMAWRNQARPSETDIYHKVTEQERKSSLGIPLGGLAFVRVGNDVRVNQPNGILRVSEIRRRRLINPSHLPLPDQDSVLHRIEVSPVGKRLSDYATVKELLDGLEDILHGLNYLHSLNIVHRDISPGNVYLSDHIASGGPEPSELDHMRGFVADLEFASFPAREEALVEEKGRGGKITFKEVSAEAKSKPGPAISGTLQFVATEVIGNLSPDQGDIVPRKSHHDLESFLLVIIGASRALNKMFSQWNPSDIRAARSDIRNIIQREQDIKAIFPGGLDDPVYDLIVDCGFHIHMQNREKASAHQTERYAYLRKLPDADQENQLITFELVSAMLKAIKMSLSK